MKKISQSKYRLPLSLFYYLSGSTTYPDIGNNNNLVSMIIYKISKKKGIRKYDYLPERFNQDLINLSHSIIIRSKANRFKRFVFIWNERTNRMAERCNSSWTSIESIDDATRHNWVTRSSRIDESSRLSTAFGGVGAGLRQRAHR